MPKYCLTVFINKLFLHSVCLFVLARQPPVGQRLLILDVARSHTTTRLSLWDSSGRVISASHRPLPDNTQHSQQTSMPPVGFETTISADERPLTYALDHAVTGTGFSLCGQYIIYILRKKSLNTILIFDNKQTTNTSIVIQYNFIFYIPTCFGI
jgi:hypothetical protein